MMGIIIKFYVIPLHNGLHLSKVFGFVVYACSFINPRRACAARVTVVVLCVRLSVCLPVSATILALQATRRLMSDTNSFSATRA